MSGPRTARELMTTPIEWAKPGDTLRQVAERMIETGFSQFPVRDRKENVGRVTDLMLCIELEQAEGVERETRKVSNLEDYSKPFEWLPPDTPFSKVRDLLLKEQAVLVRDVGTPRYLGIITRENLLKAYVGQR